jgi:hypothetical protein
MKRITKEITLLTSALHGRRGRTVIAILTIVLFILSAGAPNATIGIGK